MKRASCLAAAVTVLAASPLASCAPTPEQQYQAAADQRAQDQARCAGYGFVPGTEPFAQCLMGTSLHRQDQQAADRRAAQARAHADEQACAARVAAQHPPNPSDSPLRQKILLQSEMIKAGC